MALLPMHDLAALCEIPLLCAAITASPAMRDLIAASRSPATGTPPFPATVTRGDVIAAIYDLLMDTPLAPHAAEIVHAVLTRAVSAAPGRATAH